MSDCALVCPRMTYGKQHGGLIEKLVNGHSNTAVVSYYCLEGKGDQLESISISLVFTLVLWGRTVTRLSA